MAAPMNQMSKLFTSRIFPLRSFYLCSNCLTRDVTVVRHFNVIRQMDSRKHTSLQPSKCSTAKLPEGKLLGRNRERNVNLCYHQCLRLYANDRGPDVKGAVVYIQNPLSWLKSKWILMNLHQKYDSTFTVDEFLIGAKQALCFVTDLLSHQEFGKLQGLVHHEVVEWLEQRVIAMTEEEREALNLQDDNIALVKARGMKLEEESDTARLYIDTVCFAMKRSQKSDIPFIVDLGFRFCRDYKNNGATDWTICAVTHMHIKELGIK